ncbi:hypothetical protein PTSG_01304 [Salpingoeca rosetta]|uniref:DNA topoisomerase (ATP-hydrolyzing) n=1 Tax=Salpingoeca rosetta (strain ATCC 50818 / BSB-021) TaxID=946362 RepID=F2TZY6_SALR5|nr:uncharacterized protein PTSG_01304 [Salpingoeca rosetta]EGD80714.1 hypothetical protein PTSG_01304 [Salpingoeca rosetta]|eukprot:XP_004997275.1 hypothetical protein PTSG_01304 [Salpingoeca rosetta]
MALFNSRGTGRLHDGDDEDAELMLFEVQPAPPEVIAWRIEQVVQDILRQLLGAMTNDGDRSGDSTGAGGSAGAGVTVKVPVLVPHFDPHRMYYACRVRFRRESIFEPRIVRALDVMREIYVCVTSIAPRSIRDVYYSNIDLFGQTQHSADRAIFLVSCMLGVPRRSLLLSTSSRGLYHGPVEVFLPQHREAPVTLHDMTNNHINNNDEQQQQQQQQQAHQSQQEQEEQQQQQQQHHGGTRPIPAITDDLRLHVTATCALVVEKDAILQQLVDCNFAETHNCLLITGKGFPGVDTRYFVRLVAEQVPVYVVVDADAHGLEILCTYAYGSQSLAFQNHELAVPHIRWLGVFPSDLTEFNVALHPQSRMSDREYRLLEALSEREHLPQQMREELLLLQRMEHKAEIEILNSPERPRFLVEHYLPWKLHTNAAIPMNSH